MLAIMLAIMLAMLSVVDLGPRLGEQKRGAAILKVGETMATEERFSTLDRLGITDSRGFVEEPPRIGVQWLRRLSSWRSKMWTQPMPLNG